MIPSDIRGRQADVLESVLPKIRHPAMRARVADVVWTSDRRKAAVAGIAIDSWGARRACAALPQHWSAIGKS